jgi:hypothetical protein
MQLPLMVLAQMNKDSIEKKNSEVLIRKVLSDQVYAWNNGNLTLYMSGYWESDSLKFIGKSGIQYGWQKTLEGYKKSYPDKATMGILAFDEITVDMLSSETAFVIGKWSLIRDKGNMNGIFTLIFKRINGSWLIVCDHTS